MASIKRREDGQWRARYRDATGKEHAKHFERKADGERWLHTEQSKVDRGNWSDPARGKVTVGDWSQRWLTAQLQLKLALPPFRGHGLCGFLRIRDLE